MRRELAARDFGSAERVKRGGILDVFPAFNPARMGQKIRCPAEAELFRVSLVFPYCTLCAAGLQEDFIREKEKAAQYRHGRRSEEEPQQDPHQDTQENFLNDSESPLPFSAGKGKQAPQCPSPVQWKQGKKIIYTLNQAANRKLRKAPKQQ